MFPIIENNFKRAINCPATRTNTNEPSKQRTYWRYHCSVTYVSQQWRVIIRTSHYHVTNITEQQ